MFNQLAFFYCTLKQGNWLLCSKKFMRGLAAAVWMVKSALKASFSLFIEALVLDIKNAKAMEAAQNFTI